MKHHIVDVKIYVLIFLALMALTALTVFVAFKDFGILNDVVAMTIAVIKMLLVVLIFMHLKYSARLLWLIAGAGLIWLVIMFGITMSDYRTRAWLEMPQAWTEAQTIEQPEHHAPEAAAHH